MRSFLLLFFVCMSVTGYSLPDKKNNIWYFGYNAGLDFTGGSPVALTDGALFMWEGCATISDDKGNLLFYTDGSSIWNKDHRQMPDAQFLGGEVSSTQSATIVPYPGKSHLYYVFSIDKKEGQGGAQYALVDMNMNGGSGGIVSKNNALLEMASEKLTVIRHCNKRDFWVITHESDSNAFRSYLIDSTGVNPDYVRSRVGIEQSEYSDPGYLKASADGRKLASANYGGSSAGAFVEIYDLDNRTGKISNAVTLRNNRLATAYGIAFSPDSKLLYLSYTVSISQLDLSYSSGEAMLANMFEIGRTERSYFGALQAGPDGKIYSVIDNYGYVGVINDPNVKGVECKYVQDAIFLKGNRSGIGLPNFIESSLVRELTVSISAKPGTSACNTVVLNSVASDTLELNYQWYKDEQLIPGAEQSTWTSGESGAYQLKIQTNDCSDVRAESNTIMLTIESNLPAPIADDKNICAGDDVPTLNVIGSNITWYSDSTLQNRIATGNSFQPDISSDQPGTAMYFTTQRSDAGCESAASSIKLRVGQSPDLYLEPKDYQWCFRSQANNPLRIQASTDTDATYSWSDPDGTLLSATPFAQLWQPGNYTVTAMNETGCTASGTVTVVEYCLPLIFTPDVFTPDGDGINDIFEVKTQEPDNLTLVIYNRWGEMILQTDSGSWDGTYRQQPCPAGVYTYKLQASFTDPSGQSQLAQKAGSVLLIR